MGIFRLYKKRRRLSRPSSRIVPLLGYIEIILILVSLVLASIGWSYHGRNRPWELDFCLIGVIGIIVFLEVSRALLSGRRKSEVLNSICVRNKRGLDFSCLPKRPMNMRIRGASQIQHYALPFLPIPYCRMRRRTTIRSNLCSQPDSGFKLPQ